MFSMTRLEEGELVFLSLGSVESSFVTTEGVDVMGKTIEKILENVTLNSGVHNDVSFHSAVKKICIQTHITGSVIFNVADATVSVLSWTLFRHE